MKKLRLSKYGASLLVISAIAAVSVILELLIYRSGNTYYPRERALLFFVIGMFLRVIRPGSRLHRTSLLNMTALQKTGCLFVLSAVCYIAAAPMTLNRVWGADGHPHHRQYRALTDSILNGHLYLDYDDIDPRLEELENPYDYSLRVEQGVSYYWDHAYYKGHYYMYFGVVPVIVLFLPLRILFGIELSEAAATQIFTVLFIAGMFALFYEICRKYAREIPVSAYLAISAAASGLSAWYAVKYPALYCTAIMSGIALAVWGFYFCFRAFVTDDSGRQHLRHTVLGAGLSALVFGCRPPVGLASLLYIPMAIHYVRSMIPNGGTPKIKDRLAAFFKTLFQKPCRSTLFAFCIPYLIVAAFLMTYNYMRFENPLEFGQSYQLTSSDISSYTESSSLINIKNLPEDIRALLQQLITYEGISFDFPYVHHDGVLILFPILLIGLAALYSWNKNSGVKFVPGLCPMIFATVILIFKVHASWSPEILTRYTMDFNFLLGILLMFGVCRLFDTADRACYHKLGYLLTLFSAYTCLICFLLFYVSYDAAIVDVDPTVLERMNQFLIFWKQN